MTVACEEVHEVAVFQAHLAGAWVGGHIDGAAIRANAVGGFAEHERELGAQLARDTFLASRLSHSGTIDSSVSATLINAIMPPPSFSMRASWTELNCPRNRASGCAGGTQKRICVTSSRFRNARGFLHDCRAHPRFAHTHFCDE